MILTVHQETTAIAIMPQVQLAMMGLCLTLVLTFYGHRWVQRGVCAT